MDLADQGSECPWNAIREKRDEAMLLNVPRTPVPSARILEP